MYDLKKKDYSLIMNDWIIEIHLVKKCQNFWEIWEFYTKYAQ